MYAAMLGNEAVGLSFEKRNNDVAQERANLLRLDKINFVTADLRDLDRWKVDLGLYDQIICTEVIEHILDDRKLISNLSDLLKPGGRLLLTTPFKHYKALIGDALSEREDGGHIRWGYTHEEIGKLLKAAGIEVLERSFIGGFMSQQVENVARLILRLKILTWLDPRLRIAVAEAATFPLRVFLIADNWLTKRLRYPFIMIAVVGRKR